MEQVGKAIIRHCDNSLFDALRFFELTLYCFLTGNSDMHLKNFSLLHLQDGSIALSPAYDLLPTQLLLTEDTEDTALTLNGRKKRLRRNDFMRFAESLQLTEKQATNTFARFSSNLDTALQHLEKGLCASGTKERFKALIGSRAERLGMAVH